MVARKLSAVDSVSLAKLLRRHARDCVCRWFELMLNSENEQKLCDATSEPRRLHQDPKLAGLSALSLGRDLCAARGHGSSVARVSLSTKSKVASVWSWTPEMSIATSSGHQRHWPVARRLLAWNATTAVASGFLPWMCWTLSTAWPCPTTCLTALPCPVESWEVQDTRA